MKLQVKDLNFAYDDTIIFDNFNLEFPISKFTTIVGPNGSGKSTLAKILANIEHNFEGTISVIDGDREYDSSVGIVFQNPDNQFVNEIVKYDLAFGLENINFQQDLMEEKIQEVSKLMSITDLLDKKINKLSGGQKQRVALAGMLILGQKILILDEATSMLDPNTRKNFISYLIDICNKSDITIISITHDMEEAVLSDEVIILANGNLVCQGKPSDIFYSDILLKNQLEIPYVVELSKILKLEKKFVSLEELISEL